MVPGSGLGGIGCPVAGSVNSPPGVGIMSDVDNLLAGSGTGSAQSLSYVDMGTGAGSGAGSRLATDPLGTIAHEASDVIVPVGLGARSAAADGCAGIWL